MCAWLSWRVSGRWAGRCRLAQLASIRQMSGQVSRGTSTRPKGLHTLLVTCNASWVSISWDNLTHGLTITVGGWRGLKFTIFVFIKSYAHYRTSLVVQWLRMRLPILGTQVQSLAQEDSPWGGKTKPVCRNYWHSRARVPQEKPPQWEAHTPQLESSPCSPPLERALK